MSATKRTRVKRRGAVIERRAERQDGLLGPKELRTIGRGAIRHRCRSGRWTRTRRGVVRVTGAPQTWRQSLGAALLAAGEKAYLSHVTAARYLGVEGFDDVDWIELSAPLERKIRLPGVRAHRLSTLEESDIRTRHGLRVCSGVRLVLDLSGRLNVEQLGKLTDELLRRRLMNLGALAARVARTKPAPGRSLKKLHAMLAERIEGYDPGDSTLEARIRRLIDTHGFPAPVQQFRVATGLAKYRLDFAYPEVRVFLEGDGFGWHRFASDLDSDARRQNDLVLEGWTPLRFTWRMSDTEIVNALDRIYDRNLGAWRDLRLGRPRTGSMPERPNGGLRCSAWENESRSGPASSE